MTEVSPSFNEGATFAFPLSRGHGTRISQDKNTTRRDPRIGPHDHQIWPLGQIVGQLRRSWKTVVVTNRLPSRRDLD